MENDEDSLLGLPENVWAATCRSLHPVDVWRLHEVGGNPQTPCQARLTELTTKIVVTSDDAEYGNFNQRIGSYHGKVPMMEKVGKFYGNVRIETNCFRMDADSFQLLLSAFAAPDSRLRSIAVEIVPLSEGLDFFICAERTGHDWLRFLEACETARTDLKISLEIEVQHVVAKKLSELVAFPAADPRNRYLTNLNIRYLYELVEEEYYDGNVGCTARLLPKFPRLHKLQIQGSSINDVLLKTLADNARHLRLIKVYVDGKPSWATTLSETSTTAWYALRVACPQLKVECSAFHVDVAEEIMCYLFQLSAPLTRIGLSMRSNRTVRKVVERCSAFVDTLQRIHCSVTLSKGSYSTDPERVVRRFLRNHCQFQMQEFFEKEKCCFYRFIISRKNKAQ